MHVCVKCGQVCGGVLIYFAMFVMCVLTDLKVLHHTAVLMCLYFSFLPLPELYYKFSQRVSIIFHLLALF